MVGGKEVAGSNGDIGAYVAKVLPGGAAEQSGKILEGTFVPSQRDTVYIVCPMKCYID